MWWETAELEDNAARRLAPALAALTHLRVLKLGKNKISSAGAAYVTFIIIIIHYLFY